MNKLKIVLNCIVLLVVSLGFVNAEEAIKEYKFFNNTDYSWKLMMRTKSRREARTVAAKPGETVSIPVPQGDSLPDAGKDQIAVLNGFPQVINVLNFSNFTQTNTDVQLGSGKNVYKKAKVTTTVNVNNGVFTFTVSIKLD